MIGKTISHYKILEKLGSGGMGIVYKAQDLKLDRFVALKFLPPHLTTSKEEKQRFIHEAKSASSLDHNNICNIYEIDDTEDGQLFISMAYYEGETLDKKIKNKPLPIEEASDISIQIAQGLAKAHEKEMVHRDIKPANIMLTKEDDVKVLDFGLAKLSTQTKLTKESTTLGTVSYMSPEQAKGEDVEYRTDIWSLGVIIYEMLTGQLPFKGEYDSAVIYSILNDTQEPVTGLRTGVPMELETIINKCLQKAPDKRYQHIDEMVVDLTAIQKQIENRRKGAQSVTKTSLKRKPVYMYAGFTVVLALIILLGIYFWPEQRTPINSLAVLPLDNLSGDSEQDYIVDGMTEVLITELSRIEALSVPSRTTSMRFKNTDKSLQEIAEELQVGALVEGSVMHVGEKIRITAQLIEAETDRHIWAEDYERDFRDVLTLQKEVARAIAGEIKVQLTPHDEVRLSKAQVVDPQAYELYLLGRHNSNMARALKYLNQSIAIDPDYAPAYADMVSLYINFIWSDSLSVDEAELKARRAASKALQLDERLAEAHVAMGLVREFFDLDWSGAEQSFNRAIQLNPKSRDARMELGWLLMRLRRFDEALAEIERYHTVEDPLSITLHESFVIISYMSGRYNLSIQWCRKWLELDSTATETHPYIFIGLSYLAKGEYEKALTFVEKSMSLEYGDLDLAFIGYAYAIAGKREEALTLLNNRKSRLVRVVDEWASIAYIYAGLGEKQKALTWLEQVYEKNKFGHGPLSYLKVGPLWDSLRDEPRYKTLLKKMNFEVDY